MRVTQSLLLKNQSASISAAYARLYAVQAQLSSGRRLLAPSDDPSAIRPALDVRAGRSRLAQVTRNADFASGELGDAEGVLRNASDLLTRARELAVEGANGTLLPSDRASIATEVDGLLSQLVSLANSRTSAGFLFSGGNKGTAPFEQVDGAAGSAVLYRGDEGTARTDLGESLALELGIPGSEIFGIDARGATRYSGVTGAAAGPGNDSLRGTARLTVAHTRTVLGDGALAGTGDSASGLRIGASSASGDTVLGPTGVWSLALVDTSGTGASGSVSLNGGPAVSWSASDGDLVVTAPGGELVHLDLSSITAGFSGSVTIAGEGTVSLDGGLTTHAIDFVAPSQIVRDPQSGATAFVDGRAIARTGVDVLRPTGAYDLFASLIELRDALNNVDGEATDVQVDRIRATLGELDRGHGLLLNALSTLGARMRLVETTRARAEEFDVTLAQQQSNLEEADFTTGSIELTQAQLALQAGVTLTSRIAELPTLVQLL